ncbi:hypothetical protein TNCV_2000851 [Trichonephila clavipes]|nr:hypothetical protein TNCV_2000851 [Trichonephila clavipes]
MIYGAQLQRTLLYHSILVGEDSLPDSKLVSAENGRGVSDIRLTLYKRSVVTHTFVMSKALVLTLANQSQNPRCFLPDLG